MKFSRSSILAGALLSLAASAALAAPLPGGTLKPGNIPKYIDDLVIPPAMPNAGTANYYDIAVREFQQQVLPTWSFNAKGKLVQIPMPKTRVWGYGATGTSTFNYPAFTIEAQKGSPVTVLWRNQLVDANGNYLPHLLYDPVTGLGSIDQTVAWANPAGPIDTRPIACGTTAPPCAGITPGPYTGPVPIITHLHGAHINPGSDGYPKAWYLPNASNITDCATSNTPGCWFTKGTTFVNCDPADASCATATIPAGAARFWYRNDQRATTLWYHDHALGITRANVYAGLAGFYLYRDAYEATLNLPGPSPKLGDPPGTKYYEIPLAIQDRSFNLDGSLFYPTARAFFDGFLGPFIPGSDISPIWNPEFFGNTIVVNGKTWPKLKVEARKYRFRVLNGCDSRFLVLSFGNPNAPVVPFNIIGNDGGFLVGAPIVTNTLLVGPGERYDVIVDFTLVLPGTQIELRNTGPDSPFGGLPVPSALQANSATTAKVMRFDVVAATSPDTSAIPTMLNPPPDGLEPALLSSNTRVLTLNEIVSPVALAPARAEMGDAYGAIPFLDAISESPVVGNTETWQIVNKTVDAHPVHLHQVQFEVVGRMLIDVVAWETAALACQSSPSCTIPPNPENYAVPGSVMRPPEIWEAGQKDTIIAYPGEITKVKAKFDLAGLYVWHCHILSHEDNEMMRPFCAVVPPATATSTCAPF